MPLRRWRARAVAGCIGLLAAACTTTADTADPSGTATPAVPAAPAATSTPPAPKQTAQAGQTRALLIGVTEFIAAPMKRHNLEGPANDAELFRTVLQREPFRVPDANIRVLAGLPADAARRPTRANIQREFQALAKAAAAGDQIVILMAGHGSQQPANAEPTDDEPDGLDEIFLPADATGWDGAAGTVGNAIVDDDIRRWLTDIRLTGASVWIIFDSCQSGTMTRGAPASVERQRRIEPSELIPEKDLAAARARAANRGSAVEENVLGLGNMGEVAALFAAQANETTPERSWRDNEPVHGLFTHTLAEVLSQNTTPITYKELTEDIIDRYRAMQRYAPNPLMEGGALDREVLGQRTWPDRPLMRLREQVKNDEWMLDAGSIQGVTKGSILELFPPAGSADADKPIGHLIVRSDDLTSAVVAPVEFAKVPAPAANRLVVGSRARVRVYEPGTQRLRVAVQHLSPGNEYVLALATAISPALDKALSDLSRTSSGLAVRVTQEPADWYLRMIGDEVVLVPAGGWQVTSLPDGTDVTTGPKQFKGGDIRAANLTESIGDSLRRIGRAYSLVRMAGLPSTGADVKLIVTKHQNRTSEGQPLFAAPRDYVVPAGLWLAFELTNTGKKSLDVTLLHLDAEYGISEVFPNATSPVGINQLKPQESRTLGPYRVTDDPLGWESLLLIGVESSRTPQDFRMLAQPRLELAAEAKPLTRGGSGGPESPLQRLLMDTAFGRTRGPLEDLGEYVIKVVSWRTDPDPTKK